MTFADQVNRFRKRLIVSELQKHRYNRCAAARALGMHRNLLARWIEILSIELPRKRKHKRMPMPLRDHLVVDLQNFGWNVCLAARELGTSESTVRRWMNRLLILPPRLPGRAGRRPHLPYNEQTSDPLTKPSA
jgi:transposase-like protein